MRTYARIDGGMVAEIFATAGDIVEMFHPSLVWVDVTGAQPAPGPGWSYDGAAFHPPAAASIEQVKAAKIAELTAACDAAIGALVAYKGTQFQADEATSQSRLKGVLTAYTATTLPANFYWVDATNVQVPMTYADLQGLAAAMANQGWTAFAKLQTLKAQVNASVDASAVNAVTW